MEATEILNSAVVPSIVLNGPVQHLCYGMARVFLNTPLRRFGFRCDKLCNRWDSMDSFISDRVADVSLYRQRFAPFMSLEGKVVMDLGCNRGYLLDAFLREEKFKAIGVDIDSKAIEEGRTKLGDRIEFVQSTPESIPVADASVDVIYTIDTVEHLSHPREILLECERILRPGGLLLIDYYPWLGPYGTHLTDIIPFPWPNVVFSMDTLLDTAAYLYESSHYKKAGFYIDDKKGIEKPNPFLNKAAWDEYLNHLTIKQFKNILQQLPFELVRYEQSGFSGRPFKLARFLNRLAQIRGLDEYFTTFVLCVLRKPC